MKFYRIYKVIFLEFFMPTYIIEHLDKELGNWSLIEYENIGKKVGKKNLLFSNVKDKKDIHKLMKFGAVSPLPVYRLPFIKQKQNKICVLDPEAPKLLSSSEAKKYDYFVFGGILGDYPPRKRTQEELTSVMKKKGVKFEVRNIGKNQFSTDNAVFVVSEIVKGKNFKKMKFLDKFVLKFGKFLEMELPYSYPLVKGKALISKKLVSYLRKKKGF